MQIQESVDETIERFRRDRLMIKDRMAERNALFKKATESFLYSISNEIKVIETTNEASSKRNQEFSDQVKMLYRRYETGSERLRWAFQKTSIEKMNYNNYLLKIYPTSYQQERKRLVEENEILSRQIQGLKATFPELEVEQQSKGGIDDTAQEVMQYYEDHAQYTYAHPEYQHKTEEEPPKEPVRQKPQFKVTQEPNQGQDLISEFIKPPKQ